MSSRAQIEDGPALVVRAIRVRPTRHRRHAIIRVIGEEPQTATRRTGVVHVIGNVDDDPTAA